MRNILKTAEAVKIAKRLRDQNKTIVLIGGCFDIIHLGHIKFIQKAKEKGDVLFILLESDESARRLKGKNRPINSQKDRAIMLSAIKYVDFVIPVSSMKTDQEYDKLISQLMPDIIAVTENDPNVSHKRRQAGLIGAQVLEVVKRFDDYSTSKIEELI